MGAGSASESARDQALQMKGREVSGEMGGRDIWGAEAGKEWMRCNTIKWQKKIDLQIGRMNYQSMNENGANTQNCEREESFYPAQKLPLRKEE